MPFYRDPGNMMPQNMQDVLSMIGMRDPRSAIGMPMTTIGPRAIPTWNTRLYQNKLLAEVFKDIRKATKEIPELTEIANSPNPQSIPAPSATVRNVGEGLNGWRWPEGDLEREHGLLTYVRNSVMPGNDKYSISQKTFDNAGHNVRDELIQWLADAFLGVKR